MASDPESPVFEQNAYYERLLELRRTNPQAFAAVSQTSRSVLRLYERAKQAHLDEQRKNNRSHSRRRATVPEQPEGDSDLDGDPETQPSWQQTAGEAGSRPGGERCRAPIPEQPLVNISPSHP